MKYILKMEEFLNENDGIVKIGTYIKWGDNGYHYKYHDIDFYVNKSKSGGKNPWYVTGDSNSNYMFEGIPQFSTIKDLIKNIPYYLKIYIGK